MKSQLVFQEKTEMERLRVQNNLLSCYEAPVFAQLFSEGHALNVLDVGCNDGTKTVERFSLESVAHVIGLEYNEELAIKAEKLYGNKRFSFFTCDVEDQDFPKQLRAIMGEKHIDGFDVIYLSFVLMHLSDMSKLLAALRPFLKPEGKLVIIDANDSASTLTHDDTGLMNEFLNILKKDRYAGNREVGAVIRDELIACGYEDVFVWHDVIAAGAGEAEKKRAIFTMFFTFLPEDVRLLLSAEPENEEYKSWSTWLDRNYETLKQLVMQDQSEISMGIKILTCAKGNL